MYRDKRDHLIQLTVKFKVLAFFLATNGNYFALFPECTANDDDDDDGEKIL